MVGKVIFPVILHIVHDNHLSQFTPKSSYFLADTLNNPFYNTGPTLGHL